MGIELLSKGFQPEQKSSSSAKNSLWSKVDLKEKLSAIYDVKDSNSIFVFKFRTHFGYGLIYDSVDSAKKFEPKYRLIRNGLDTKVEKSRKQMKERNNRAKNIHGVKKTKAGEDTKGGKKK